MRGDGVATQSIAEARRTDVLAGTATGVGSLPHRDAHAAAALVLRCLPDLPAAPQLPARTRREGIVAQWADAISGVGVQPDGSLVADALSSRAAIEPVFTRESHAGLLTFLDVAATQARPPRHLKTQIVGPLTLGVALLEAGVAADVAFPLAARTVRAWIDATEALVASKLPGSSLVLFLDEPALVLWRAEGPTERETAIDLLSTTLASAHALMGVHVCGHGDLRLALDAGPDVAHLDVGALDLDDALWLARFLDGGGWIAWGAIPTHRPVGEQPQPLWHALVDRWCELTRRGCDPVRLRSQALVAPACGLAGHGTSQAERAMLLAREIGNRVHDQAAATKLTIGA
ncbi:MAG TPA: hypothetical protein VFR41_06045 [Acidimicrobiia bacterium]|nr:hypothetical protein [Acidimicrobiia bacterium]